MRGRPKSAHKKTSTERNRRLRDKVRQERKEAIRLLQSTVLALERYHDDETLALLGEMQAYLRPLGEWPYDKED